MFAFAIGTGAYGYFKQPEAQPEPVVDTDVDAGDTNAEALKIFDGPSVDEKPLWKNYTMTPVGAVSKVKFEMRNK